METQGITGLARTLWARGHYVSIDGPNEPMIRRYNQRQEDGGKIEWEGAPIRGLDGNDHLPTATAPHVQQAAMRRQ